jgi:hypothetical protein
MKKKHFLGPHQRMPATHCLNCERLVDGASGVDTKGKPRPGNITVCIYCGHLMAFARDLSMRELTGEEMREIAGDERVLAAQRAAAEFRKKP